jgi:tight adherence protein C
MARAGEGVTAAAPLAAAAVLLGAAALRELRPSGGGDGGSPLAFLTRGRSARAALRLGLPERIRQAGLERRLSLGAALVGKLACAAAGGLAAMLAAPAAPGRLAILAAIGIPAAGFVLPDALLEREARRRRRRTLAALPDVLDLLAVASASGRSTETGFAEIARSGEGPLAEVLSMTVAELSCGVPLPQALGRLRERVPGSEVASLCASIERSRRLGSPLADQLRRQSAGLRRDQRRTIEERAARAAPKIQLVIALVLVPSVLLLIAAGLIANADVLLGGF